MTWLAVLAVYALLVAVYCLGHQLGYSKGRRIGRCEGWMVSEGSCMAMGTRRHDVGVARGKVPCEAVARAGKALRAREAPK